MSWMPLLTRKHPEKQEKEQSTENQQNTKYQNVS